ncbi:pyridine nucleotide-disulfide oxidoreductase [Rathayibacter sp. AY1C2]|uniref:FAD-dependent oxidoreductase n=1 Tax=unclassified Rathayibacter TaxID=2609250 RepID=UPI000CE88745|nr:MULTISPECIES: FAD-dependent oxidoreductase [unclassified Rathayibacter]PPF10327.1 pyridine nucleotide-disulfide oxidoreductase [Rathayibacter sp. AY1A5]PPF35093.1 pyridine nucleotide-disulfide oxidoreductase [Rathayibacter sp. AY1A2]PPF55566.1 pyridine nucleotide-disulfide oxidoreductase [Rathayibacter sp. AY1C2]PPG37667.1 pyridine nucleotide-disulfide oxidoreductase [Rathayibacter sp. AY2B5]PPH34892.1 pyridine nucleotide-disulfide oxidoreductase [Rathayibacter sp. AY1E3]
MDSVAPPRPVVVIGAGQAGLSVAYYLRRLGLVPGRDLIVLDRGPEPGGAWQFRWEALRLGSAHRVHDLPGMERMGFSFRTADHRRPARDVVREYYGRYEEELGLEIRRPESVRRVTSATPHDTGSPLVVESDRAVERASLLVNATGTWGSPFVPHYPGRDRFRGVQIDPTEYVRAEDFAGKQVLVVGGGTSAIGFLLELERVARSLTWATRRPVVYHDGEQLAMESAVEAVAEQDRAARAGLPLPSIVGGTGVQRTRRVVAGIERGLLHERGMFSSIEEEGVRWPDGSFTRADAIIWATGFRPELRHLAPLGLREREGGIAVADGASLTDPRVFFAGYGPTASTIGANRSGRRIARAVVARLP